MKHDKLSTQKFQVILCSEKAVIMQFLHSELVANIADSHIVQFGCLHARASSICIFTNVKNVLSTASKNKN